MASTEYMRTYRAEHRDQMLLYQREYMRGWREKNREKVRQYARDWRDKNKVRDVQMNRDERQRLKLEVFRHYSSGDIKCAKCGFQDIRALQLDHIQDNGAQHRKALGARTSAGTTYYRWLRKNGLPPGMQVLCANCNWIKQAERVANDSA